MNNMETDIIFDKLQSIICGIARNNSCFKCSCCLDTADDLFSLARYCCGADAAGLLEDYFNEIMKEDEDYV